MAKNKCETYEGKRLQETAKRYVKESVVNACSRKSEDMINDDLLWNTSLNGHKTEQENA